MTTSWNFLSSWIMLS